MTVDLAALDAANAKLQADPKAAVTVKAYAKANTAALHAAFPAPVPAPPPPTTSPAPPVGPFTVSSAGKWFRDVSQPTEIGKLQITTADTIAFGLMGFFTPDRPPPSPSPFNVHDIIGVSTSPYDPTGRAGSGVWLGTAVNAARIVGTGPDEGIWTGCNFFDSSVTDFTAKGAVGVYIEHVSRNSLFKNGDVQGTVDGIRTEWWYGGEGSHDLTFDTLRIFCPAAGHGIALGPGTFGCTIRNCHFWGPGPAIAKPAHLAGPTDNVIDLASCVFDNAGAHVDIDSNPIG